MKAEAATMAEMLTLFLRAIACSYTPGMNRYCDPLSMLSRAGCQRFVATYYQLLQLCIALPTPRSTCFAFAIVRPRHLR